jgi:transcriptional regulator with XRE-family HTH domain
MTDFVDRLKQAAGHAGIGDSQADIARALELKRQTVNRWFVLGGEPSSDLIFDIAKRFGVNPKWLKTGEGQMSPEPANDDFSSDELSLIRDYRSSTPKVKDVIRAMARAARKVATVVIASIPPLLASPESSQAAPVFSQVDRVCIMLNRALARILARTVRFLTLSTNLAVS